MEVSIAMLVILRSYPNILEDARMSRESNKSLLKKLQKLRKMNKLNKYTSYIVAVNLLLDTATDEVRTFTDIRVYVSAVQVR